MTDLAVVPVAVVGVDGEVRGSSAPARDVAVAVRGVAPAPAACVD